MVQGFSKFGVRAEAKDTSIAIKQRYAGGLIFGGNRKREEEQDEKVSAEMHRGGF